MFIVVRNTRARIVLALIPIILFLIVYFTVIRPDQNTANQVLTQGLQQVQAGEKQANQQVQSDNSAPASVKNLTACIAAAGTNTTALQQCQAKYQK